MSLRLAAPGDAAALARLHAAAFDHPWSDAAVAELLAGAGVFGLMADQGFILCRTVGGEAEILTLAVHPVARRSGLGRALVEAAADAAAGAAAAVDGAFPIDATRIYGTNDDGDARIAMTTGQVKDRLKALAFTYPDETAARSDIERSYDSINLKSYKPATGNDFSPGFASIMALLPTRNKIIISVPPGDYDLSSTLNLIQTAAGQSIVLQGAGRGATRFIAQHSGHWCRLGWRSGPVLSKNIEVRDCSFVANVAQTAGYAAFVVEHIYQYRLRNVEIISAATDFILGNPDVADDAQQGLIDGLYASGAMAGTSRVLLHSGSILVFTDTCKFNGNGAGDGLFAQTNPGFNWDGLVVGKLVAEQQPRLLTVSGKGLANVDFDGGISDRPSDYHVYIKPVAGGEVNRIAFRGWKFQSRAEANVTYGILLDASNGSKIKDVSINACKMFLAGRSGIQMADPGSGVYRGINLNLNTFENCGYTGVALMRLAAGHVTASNNMGWHDGASGYTHGESWNGASGGRVSSANNWLGYATAASVGTP